MLTKATRTLPELKHVKLGAINVGLHTKTQLDRGCVIKGLAKLQQIIPALSESDFKKKDGKRPETFKLENTGADYSNQILFLFRDYTDVDLAWGPDVDYGRDEQLVKFFDCLQDEFEIHPLLVEYIDVQIHFITQEPFNHYRAIWDAYFAGSPIYKAIKAESILEDDIAFRFLLGDNVVGVVTVESTISDKALRLQKFEGNKLTVKLGVAQIREIPANGRLSDLIIPHVRKAEEFAVNHFVPSFVKALDDACAAHSK